MSFWDKLTKPVNDVLDSNVFKAVMPVQALGQEAVKLGTGLTGINGGKGLNPADQYAIGAGTGAALAGGAAIAGSGAAPASGASVAGEEGPMASISPMPGNATPAASSSAASPWEAHASQARYSSNPLPPGGSGYNTQKKQNPMPMMQLPVMHHTDR